MTPATGEGMLLTVLFTATGIVGALVLGLEIASVMRRRRAGERPPDGDDHGSAG